MKSLKDHPFFEAIEFASKTEKKSGRWGVSNANKFKFFNALKQAHPFIFDKSVTFEKRMAGRAFEDIEDLVQDFSLPRSTSLYLMTKSPIISAPMGATDAEHCQVELLGYLIHELTPELFSVFEVSWITLDGQRVADIHPFTIDLKTISTVLRMTAALEVEIFNERTDSHVLREIGSILSFTKSISVKRIGVEHARRITVKSRNVGVGYTVVKYDNIIHIADKVNYEYVEPCDVEGINWDFIGFWRGFWRAFYLYDSNGKKIKDSNGWNTVDYSKTGKTRTGEYTVSGYTWVVEHTKGDPALAQIKARVVKAK